MLILLLLAVVVLFVLAAFVHPVFIFVGGPIVLIINQRRIRRNERLAREKRAAQRATATTRPLQQRNVPVSQPLRLDPNTLLFFLKRRIGAARPANEICRTMRRYGHEVSQDDVIASLESLVRCGQVKWRYSKQGNPVYWAA